MKTKRGFSLPEVVMALAVISLLVAITAPSFQNALLRNKVRKTADLITECISMAKSEALRRNVKTYLQVVGTDLCIGTTVGGCDLRQEPLVNGVSVSATQLTLSPFYGVPSPAPAVFTVSYSGVSQSVSINKLGVVTVGVLS